MVRTSIAAGLMLVLQESVGRAQQSLNVTNYGAVGDLTLLTSVSTVSNSTAVVCAGANFSSADTNKVIEIFGAGIYRNPSNETLFAFITGVSSVSNITVSVAAGATASGLTGVYATDSQPAFSNAIAACSFPTDTIIIPAGNYLLIPRDFLYGFSGYWPTAFYLTRGGISFLGQSNVTLTAAGGWKDFGGGGYRGTLFVPLVTARTNDYPLVFSNLTLDGGVSVGNIHNTGFPIDPTTGLGWDSSHHWLLTEGDGSGGFLSHLVMLNCTIQHWRGEMMEATEGSPNLYLNATNCLFTDGDGSCINSFAHNCVACTFSNANQAEEFYRSYATNASFMTGSTISSMNGCAIALNGGIYGEPFYTISGNTFTNCPYCIETTPAINVMFVSNTVFGGNALGIGVAGYQGNGNPNLDTINSNIVVAANTFNGVADVLSFQGGGKNAAADVYCFSNQINNALVIVSGYGFASNVWVFDNTGTNNASFSDGQLTGQYAVDRNNQYNLNPFIPQGRFASLGVDNSPDQQLTNTFSYQFGSRGQINFFSVSNCIFALDTSQASQIPPGAVMVIKNAASSPAQLGGDGSYRLYFNSGFNTAPLILAAGQSATFYWNGSTWTNSSSSVKPFPPFGLRAFHP